MDYVIKLLKNKWLKIIKLWWVVINAKGEVNKKLIIELEQSCFYNIWTPVNLDEHTSVINFTFENGNGWIVINDGHLINCFIRNEEKNGYTDIATKETITLNISNPIISGISSSMNKHYQVSFYSKEDSELNIVFISI